VARQRDEWVAFLEDTATGKTMRVLAGQDVQGGTIAAISFSGIEYYCGDERKTVLVGQTLAGKWPEPRAKEAPAPAGGPPGTAGRIASQASSGGGTAGQLSTEEILDRMRRRREQEMNR